MQQPVVEATAVEFANAGLKFAQMALLDLCEPLPFFGRRSDADALLIEQVHLAIQVLHQVEQCVALLDLLGAEMSCEVTHPAVLKDQFIISR